MLPTKEQVEKWFTHGGHTVEANAADINQLHEKAREFALFLIEVLPQDRPESQLALQRLEESVMWGNTALSR